MSQCVDIEESGTTTRSTGKGSTIEVTRSFTRVILLTVVSMDMECITTITVTFMTDTSEKAFAAIMESICSTMGPFMKGSGKMTIVMALER